MESQKRQLDEALNSTGWCVAERESITSDWWADEIWTIESVWRPVGFTLFLTFLVDPQSDLHQRDKEVWAITCSSVPPQTRSEAMTGPTISVRSSWEKNLPDFVSEVKKIRDLVTDA